MIEIVHQSVLPYQLGPMQTTVEGEPEEVMRLVLQCHEAMKTYAPRVLTTILIDDRKGDFGGLDRKVRSVKEKLDRKG